tara:strand:+ start:1326 stop:2528 length:1203 start_codon:yes stop_codon:yes gene_type:complete
MMDRRTLFAGAAYSSTLAWLFGGSRAVASASGKPAADAKAGKTPLEFDEMLPNADVAGQMDFHAGFLAWSLNDFEKQSTKRLQAILAEKGIDPKAENVDLIPLLDDIRNDPLMALRMRTWLSNQELMLGGLEETLGRESEKYFAEMEAAEAKYPNRIELNPDMHMPDYAKHEIHLQKGGYVGNPLAGYVNYHYGNILYEALFGSNIQDERIALMAAAVPLPDDGKVERALDMGCGTGRLAYGLKNRFPAAKVSGIDIAGPMVRFSHKRAVDLGIDCFFAQRSAEATGFPDNHFDVIASNILHHEVDAAATDKIVAEAFRILRPGGIFYPIDHPTGKQAPKKTVSTKFWAFNDRAINNEVWRADFESRDFGDLIRKVGFVVDETLPPAVWGTGSIKAVKPA